MEESEIKEKLRQLDLIHREDYDGGYYLVSDIRSYSQGLSEEERTKLKEVLLDSVRNQEKSMWGVSLETLVQEWGRDVREELVELLKENNGPDDEWRHHVIFSLLRIGETSEKDTYVHYITKRLERKDYTVLPLLAALSQVDPNLSIEIAAKFFAQLTESELTKISGCISAFVLNFIKVDTNLLMRLAESTKSLNKYSGSLIADFLIEYLERPYVKKKIGHAEAEELITMLQGAGRTSH